MTDRGFRVRALGEIALHCADLPAMVAFYRDTLGLEMLADRGGIVFFRLGESYGGHSAVLGLFAGRDAAPGGALHHLALTIDAAEQDAAIRYLNGLGLPCRVEGFPWIGWRGVFTQDPEGNTVELVAKIAPGTETAET